MAKCTGKRCPMQVGFKVNECNYKECPYRTEPITRADHIRAMTDEELVEFLRFGFVPITICDLCEKIVASESACNDNSCRKALMKWLQQPAKGGENNA